MHEFNIYLIFALIFIFSGEGLKYNFYERKYGLQMVWSNVTYQQIKRPSSVLYNNF